jgi:hypothetical protein
MGPKDYDEIPFTVLCKKYGSTDGIKQMGMHGRGAGVAVCTDTDKP